MRKKFQKVIPKTPVFRKEMYRVPERYAEVYAGAEVKDPDEQSVLFYITQFGGCRFKRVPKYVEEREKFLKKWLKIKRQGGFVSFKASETFLSEFGHLEPEPLVRNRYKGQSFGDDVLAETGISRKDMEAIEEIRDGLNRHYESMRIGLNVPRSGTTAEDKVDLVRLNSVPNFQIKPRAGNRLFHSGPGSSYQGISSNLRHYLTIDGKPTTEFDISAATIQFLNIIAKRHLGTTPMSEEELSVGDPYQYFLDQLNGAPISGVETLDRDAIKEILYTLIFSPTNSQRYNVNRKLKLLGQNYSYSAIEYYFPQFVEVIDDIKNVSLNGNGECFPAHLLIFQEESRYAREVLKRGCLEKGLPILPLHDSFITQRQHAKKLETLVHDVAVDLYGRPLAFKRKF